MLTQIPNTNQSKCTPGTNPTFLVPLLQGFLNAVRRLDNYTSNPDEDLTIKRNLHKGSLIKILGVSVKKRF